MRWVLIAALALVAGTRAAPLQGVMDLDAVSLPRILGYKPMLVRFGRKYGPESDKWTALAEEILNSTNLLVGHVSFSEYDKANAVLATAAGVEKEPSYVFYTAGETAGPQFVGTALSAAEIKVWLRNVGIRVLSKSPLPELSSDRLVAEFVKKASKKLDTANVIKRATEAVETLPEEKQSLGREYVTFMKLVAEKGLDVLESEISRVTKMLENKSVAPKKLQAFKTRLAMLNDFANYVPEERRSEEGTKGDEKQGEEPPLMLGA
eukprot:TRINITY_DN3956_c0_g1_i1.p1 TRINITY_DN3956_c0_g1~~TRINITY_DN3956_c0_g1_i1.p1  ORF type:complete len:275 (+),score=75.03 TRINITY_DN3956_c0_g1_i1:36-827(+)